MVKWQLAAVLECGILLFDISLQFTEVTSVSVNNFITCSILKYWSYVNGDRIYFCRMAVDNCLWILYHWLCLQSNVQWTPYSLLYSISWVLCWKRCKKPNNKSHRIQLCCLLNEKVDKWIICTPRNPMIMTQNKLMYNEQQS